MPADRTLGADIAQALIELYGDAQQEIAENVARRLKQGIDEPGWDHAKLAAIGELRHTMVRLLGKLNADSSGMINQIIVLAFARGGQAAVDELAKTGKWTAHQLDAFHRTGTNPDAVARLAFALRSTLLGTHLRILRWSLDAYREVVTRAAATGPGLIGIRTRLQVAQDAWSKLVEQGITGFVDKAGRHWQLSSYVEMATRTVITHAVVEAHSDRLDAMGVDLRIVSNAPQECVKCRPWEGKILTAKGGRRILMRTTSVTTGEPLVVRVAGSVDQAIAAGLLHPNCRHTINAYLPGATKLPTNTQDPEGDKARQKLRALERRVRKAKLQQLTALDPVAAKAAAAKVRAIQGQIRDHLADNPGLLRQRHREQIGAGNIPPDQRPGNGRQEPTGPSTPPEPKPSDDDLSRITTAEPEPERKPAEPSAPAPTKSAADYRRMTDDELDSSFAQGVESGDDDAVDQVLAEMDSRQALHDQANAERAEQQRQDAERAAARAEAEQAIYDEMDPEQAAQWKRFDQLLAGGESEESAAEQVFGRDQGQQRRDRAIAQLRGQGYTGRGFDELARKAYRDHVYQQYLAAEDVTRGHMVTPAGQAAHVDPHSLFTGPAARARKWASDELKQWWDNHGRLTYDEWAAGLLGDTPGFGGTTGDSWLQ